MPLRLRLLDTRIAIETGDDDLGALLARLWEPFVTQDAGEPHASFVVSRDRGTLVVEEGKTRIHHADVWTLVDALRYRMLELVERGMTGHLSLHAAAVEREGSLTLLAGPSGTGKTTLTLALLDAGWTYLSDDVAPIEVATGMVAPFPKPLGVKDPAAWERMDGPFAGLHVDRPEHGFLVPAAAYPVATAPLPPGRLVFPRFEAGAEVEVEPLTAAKATALATAYVRRLDPEAVRILNRLCTASACLGLVYGDSESAVAALSS